MCHLLFDSYLIKYLIVQTVTAFLSVFLCFKYLFAGKRLRINPVILVFISAYVLVNIFSWFLIPSIYKFPSMWTMSTVVVYALWCMVVSQYARGQKYQNAMLFVWVAAAILECTITIMQVAHGDRALGTLGNENFLAGFLGLTIPVSVGYFLSIKKRIMYYTGGVIVSLFLVVLYMTHSRGAWIGICASTASVLIITFGKIGKRVTIVLSLGVIVLALLFLPYLFNFVAVQFGGDVRPAIWEGTLYMILEKPLIGWGKGAYFIFYPKFRVQEYWSTKCPTDLTVHAHNEYLQILAETGVAGLVMFAGLVILLIKYGVRKFDNLKARRRYILLGMICGIIGLLAHNVVCNNLQMPSSAVFLWCAIGVVISYISTKVLRWRSDGLKARLFFLAFVSLMVIIVWHTGIKPTVEQYLFKKGWNYRADGNYAKAIEIYSQAEAWYPWDVELHYRAAYAYTMNDEYDRAIKEYHDVIRLAPLYGSVHRNLGIVYMKNGEYKNAKVAFVTALRVNEKDVSVNANLSKMKGAEKNIKETE